MKEHQKEKPVAYLRQAIKNEVSCAVETDRAEASLCNLSFQSLSYPDKHVWIGSIDKGEFEIDLEDWSKEGEWDNAIMRVTISSEKECVQVVKRWLCSSC